MRLAGFVVLGLAVAAALYYVTIFVLLETLLPGYTETEATLWVSFLIVAPVSVLLGSVLTGYFVYPRIDNKWKLVAATPGLYLGGIFIVLMASSTIVVDAVLLGAFWFLISLSGIGLGYFLRSCVKRRHLVT